MSDRIADTNGITSRQPTTFGAKIHNATSQCMHLGLKYRFFSGSVRPSVTAMKQDTLKVAALSLLAFVVFILTSLSQVQSSHAQNGTTTMAETAPTAKTVEQ